jgi:hypothetical protein
MRKVALPARLGPVTQTGAKSFRVFSNVDERRGGIYIEKL